MRERVQQALSAAATFLLTSTKQSLSLIRGLNTLL